MAKYGKEDYLPASEIIDWQNPTVFALAKEIASDYQSQEAIARACFEWVRDRIFHSVDYQMNPVTCRASDVLTAIFDQVCHEKAI